MSISSASEGNPTRIMQKILRQDAVSLGMLYILKMHQQCIEEKVALLSSKAELNAAVLCVQDMMYQSNMLESIGLKVELPMILEMDNKGAVNLVNSFSVGGCTQHINV